MRSQTQEIRDQKKFWYWGKTTSEKECFISVVCRTGSATLRVFDAKNGIYEGQRGAGSLDELQPFVGKATPLTLERHPNLARDCRRALPREVLIELRAQAYGGNKILTKSEADSLTATRVEKALMALCAEHGVVVEGVVTKTASGKVVLDAGRRRIEARS